MIITLEARVAARCKACSVLTPVPGLRNKLSCRNCAAPIDFAARAADSREGGLRYPFGGYYDAVAEAALLLREGQNCRDARDSQGTPVALKGVAGPVCVACDAALPAPSAGAASVQCPACGDSIAIRWPDDETRTWDPRIAYVVGDGKGQGKVARDAPAQGTTQGVLVSCAECGGTIAGEGQPDRRRSRTCGFCGAANYLPDAAWLALFPAPEWHRSFLVYQIDERGLLALHDWMARENKYWLNKEQEAALQEAHAQARRAARKAVATAAFRGEASATELEALARDATLTEAEAAAVDAQLDEDTRLRVGMEAPVVLVRRWVTAPSTALRIIAAGHPGSGEELLATLAGDSDAAVRKVVAARPDTPAATLALLRKDGDPKVAKAVRKNPGYKPGLFEKLFG